MDIIGGAYGGSSPRGEMRAELHSARSSLEEALGHWQGLEEAQRLERLALSLLSLHRVQMTLDALESSSEWRGAPSDLRLSGTPERPSLVDLNVDEQRATARVKLVFGDEDLVGESPCRPDAGHDHTAPARATLEALDPLLRNELQLEDARVLQIVDGPFAVVTLRNEARLLVGSALIEDDLGVAVARATLNAANRFISGVAPEDQTIKLN